MVQKQQKIYMVVKDGLHITTANPWGYTAVSGSILWGLFPTASSWLALSFMDTI